MHLYLYLDVFRCAHTGAHMCVHPRSGRNLSIELKWNNLEKYVARLVTIHLWRDFDICLVNNNILIPHGKKHNFFLLQVLIGFLCALTVLSFAGKHEILPEGDSSILFLMNYFCTENNKLNNDKFDLLVRLCIMTKHQPSLRVIAASF